MHTSYKVAQVPQVAQEPPVPQVAQVAQIAQVAQVPQVTQVSQVAQEPQVARVAQGAQVAQEPRVAQAPQVGKKFPGHDFFFQSKLAAGIFFPCGRSARIFFYVNFEHVLITDVGFWSHNPRKNRASQMNLAIKGKTSYSIIFNAYFSLF